MNLTESNSNPLLISMNENIDDGKCDRKVYKVIASGSNKWQNKKQIKRREKEEEAINSWVSKEDPVQSHVHSLSINMPRRARKIGKKIYLKKNKNSQRDRQEILMTSFRQRLYLIFLFKLFLFLFYYCWYFLSLFLLFCVTLPNMLSYWFILFRSNNTKCWWLYLCLFAAFTFIIYFH